MAMKIGLRMGLRNKMANLLNGPLERYGFNAIEDWQKKNGEASQYKASLLSDRAKAYLKQDNPRLKVLKQRYAAFDSKVTTPLVWVNNHLKNEDLQYFRGDNAYVWQLRGPNMEAINYALTTYYIKSIDELNLLNILKEDADFGIFTFLIDGKVISRDLIDSIAEIYFLEKNLGISTRANLNILDIGAGYGRLAHRMVNALPNIDHYFCTDAVAHSTFISEFYIRHREIDKIAKVIPLDEIENILAKQRIDIALNIHSFSECKIDAIEWWVSLLARYNVQYLMIAPNQINHGGELLLNHEGQEFQFILEKHGYQLIAKEPKYRDTLVQDFGLNSTFHFLFQRLPED